MDVPVINAFSCADIACSYLPLDCCAQYVDQYQKPCCVVRDNGCVLAGPMDRPTYEEKDDPAHAQQNVPATNRSEEEEEEEKKEAAVDDVDAPVVVL
jgi:hypothetical protein